MTDFNSKLKKVLSNINKIPEEFFGKAKNGEIVIWLLDREDGTARSYETSRERLGITKDGNVIWGFTSGCSCWDGWSADDYAKSISYKEFISKKIWTYKGTEDSSGRYAQPKDYDLSFAEGWENESTIILDDYLILIKGNYKPEDVFKVKNSEVRRYIMKSVDYKEIKDKLNANVLHTDGTSELLDIKIEGNVERYVKVKDSSTEREYLLNVPTWNIKTCKQAIAWTFGLSEAEYNPIMEA